MEDIPGTRIFVRPAKFNEERKFPEHGVAVEITEDVKLGMIIHCRNLLPRERLKRPKGLTDRSRKV